MAFTVTFYSFSKKSNSTSRPSGGAAFDCTIKTDSSVVQPRIELNYAGNPSGWNYCYIQHYGRYYYITDWTYTPGLWVASCQTDVLASYKTEIGSTSLYVLRSSAEYDGNILDTMYPPCLPLTSDYTISEMTGWAHTVAGDSSIGDGGGSFVVGIIGSQNSSMYGSTSYYVFDYGQMRALYEFLFQDAPQIGKNNAIDNIIARYDPQYSPEENQGFSLVEVFDYYHRVNVNPIQYITSCMFFPFKVSTGPVEKIYFGFYDSGISAPVLGSTTRFNQNIINLTSHPQASDRGAYANLSPYTRRWVNSPIFGDIELDTSLLGPSGSQIQITTTVDHVSGGATCQINAVINNAAGPLLAMRSGQVGVSIAVAQAYRNVSGGIAATNAAVGATAQAAAGITTGAAGIASGILTAISAIDSIDKAVQPHIAMVGSDGGMASTLRQRYVVFNSFNTIPAEDNEHRGRPLMQKRTPASLGGYLLISDGDVPIPGTSGEQAEVRATLEAGFFYE